MLFWFFFSKELDWLSFLPKITRSCHSIYLQKLTKKKGDYFRVLFLKLLGGQKATFIPVFFSLIAGQPEKKNAKRSLPFLKLSRGLTLSTCRSCKQVKDSGENKTFYKFVMPSFLLLQMSQSCNMLQAESFFNNSHLLVHILGYIRGHTAHLALIINLIMLSKYQLSRIFTEDTISPVTLSSQTAQKLNNERTLQALP